jgi:hypothetical protein
MGVRIDTSRRLEERPLSGRVGVLEATRRVHQFPALFFGPVASTTVMGLWSIDVTGGTFESVWEAWCPTVPYPGLYLRFTGNDGGVNSGEWRVQITVDEGVFYTPVFATTGTPGSTFRRSLAWLHGRTLHGGPIHMEWQARRIAGAGGIGTYRPTAVFVDPATCTTSPTWEVSLV